MLCDRASTSLEFICLPMTSDSYGRDIVCFRFNVTPCATVVAWSSLAQQCLSPPDQAERPSSTSRPWLPPETVSEKDERSHDPESLPLSVPVMSSEEPP